MDKVKRDREIDDLFITSLNNKVFPGAIFACSQWDGEGYKREGQFYGHAQLDPEKIELKRESVFDLASLTKALTTVPLLLTLFEKNRLDPQSRLGEIYPLCPDDKAELTVEQLMSHSSGFAAHREFYKQLLLLPEEERKTQLLKRIFEDDLLTVPGEKHCYSDIGYMVLGLIIEKISGQGLDQLANDLLYGPLGLGEDLFYPGLGHGKECSFVSTEICPWSGNMLRGEVHDDNCRVLGGVAGHAGLFGTLHGVLSLCERFLDQWKGRGKHPAYSNKLLQRILEPVNNSGWTMGFDRVSEKGSSSGHYFSKESVGHLGFTGTSFWIDPLKECIVVLLTNRVHPSRDNWQIKKFRPVFHDLLMGE